MQFTKIHTAIGEMKPNMLETQFYVLLSAFTLIYFNYVDDDFFGRGWGKHLISFFCAFHENYDGSGMCYRLFIKGYTKLNYDC